VLPAPPTHYASRYPSSTPARGAGTCVVHKYSKPSFTI
jgi:hypothetical protein